jgi:excisionase family DNA binding protein
MAAAGKPVPDSSPPVMTVEDVAQLLRIHHNTLYRLIKARQIPCFRVGFDYRFNREALDAWRRAQEAQPSLPQR